MAKKNEPQSPWLWRAFGYELPRATSPTESGYESERMDRRAAIEAAINDHARTAEAKLAEHPSPETPTQAARALIGWFAGALAFKCIETLGGDSYLPSLGYGLGAIVVATIDYNLKRFLAGSPRLTKTLNHIAGDARWWGAAAMISLIVVSLSPYVEQRRWPYSTPTSAPSAAKPQTDSQYPTVTNSQVIEELKTLRSQIDDLRRQNDALRAAQSNLLAIGESPVGEKIIVETSPAYLMDLYENKMSSEGDRLFAPYVGKWLQFAETVSDVSGNLVSAFEKAPNGTYRTINMFFDTESSDRLAVATRGQKISVSCQIWFARDTNLRLHHCEFASK